MFFLNFSTSFISKKKKTYTFWNYGYFQKGISKQNLYENLETLHLASMLFNHLSGFYHGTGILNLHPLSLGCATFS